MLICSNNFATATEDCKLVVTCKMQYRNATDKLNPQCTTITEICGRITMLVYYMADLADQLHFYFAFCILQVTTNLQSSVVVLICSNGFVTASCANLLH